MVSSMRVPTTEEIEAFHADRRAKGLPPVHVCRHCGGFHFSGGCRNVDWSKVKSDPADDPMPEWKGGTAADYTEFGLNLLRWNLRHAQGRGAK